MPFASSRILVQEALDLAWRELQRTLGADGRWRVRAGFAG
jgi:hypothetical protein